MAITVPSSLEHRKIPLKDLQAEILGKRITVGVAIVANSSSENKLLLLQRSATEDVLPNMYELPGGNVDDSDATVLDTVQREALEETGFTITQFLAEFEPFEYTTKRGDARQLNFLVAVNELNVKGEEPTPTLSPDEHQAYKWASSSDPLSDLPMSEGMSIVVQNAFKAMSNLAETV